MAEPEAIHPSQRLIVAKSWWVASELARRHPELQIVETRPYEGADDNLCLVHPRTDPELELIRLDRLGVLEATPLGGIGWDDVIAAEDPHAIVRALETWAGLAAPLSAPPTSPPILIYRIIARVLASLVDDRHVWNCRWGLYETCNRTRPSITRHIFPTVDQAMDADPFEVDSGSFWVLERGEQPMACFDVRGHLHSMHGEVVDLMPIYRAHSSSLTKTIGIALGDRLP